MSHLPTDLQLLVAGWEVIRVDDGSIVSRRRQSYAEAVGSMSYPAIVAAQSRTLAFLSQDIVASIGQGPAGF